MSRFGACQKGGTAIEYALLAALLAIAAITGLTALSGSVAALFERIGSGMP